jgi:hypothetical protein
MRSPDRVTDTLAVIRGLDDVDRRRLARVLVEKGAALHWVAAAGEGVSDDLLADERQAFLEEHAVAWALPGGPETVALLRAELSAGRPLSTPVVAAVRRTVRTSRHLDPELLLMAGELNGAPLNPGEPWADRALADLHRLDDDWLLLLRHAFISGSARPTKRWEGVAREIIDRIGAGSVRSTLLPWLALVGRPRTMRLRSPRRTPDVNALDDPYNAVALRGLVSVLGLLPPHDRTVTVLGRLVVVSLDKARGVGPRDPKIASAAVVSLSRIRSDAAVAELTRLAGAVSHQRTASQITGVLAAK